MKKLAKIKMEIERCLESHPAVSENENPVLVSSRSGKCCVVGLQKVIEQYCALPRTIVELLGMGVQRLGSWSAVKAELERNIAEEQGSRTEGVPHVNILGRLVQETLGSDIWQVPESPATVHFLSQLKTGLKSAPLASVAGMIYALEDSASPELRVVGRIVNEWARLRGADESIDFSRFADRKRLRVLRVCSPHSYSLQDFLYLHLLDFEQGHRNRLWHVLKPYIQTQEAGNEFKNGFEVVMSAMDEWWRGLSREACR